MLRHCMEFEYVKSDLGLKSGIYIKNIYSESINKTLQEQFKMKQHISMLVKKLKCKKYTGTG